jgi:hypothetical protein
MSGAKSVSGAMKDSEVLCTCVSLSRGLAQQQIDMSPGQSFDKFLESTGAGRTCTACMLNLEYFFVETPRGRSASVESELPKSVERLSLKRQIYAVLDRIPWMLPFNRTNWMPVFYGAGFEQYLWVANHAMLFEDAEMVVEFRVNFVVRDESGNVVSKQKFALDVGEFQRINLSELMPLSDELRVGSVAVDKFAEKPGLRGTTRPQTEIIGPGGASTLHLQAAGRKYGNEVMFCDEPDVQKVGFTAVNAGPEPVDMRLRYRELGNDAVLQDVRVTVAPWASKLLWVELSDVLPRDQPGKRVMMAQYEGIGLSKMHLVIADANLSRLSLDHL